MIQNNSEKTVTAILTEKRLAISEIEFGFDSNGKSEIKIRGRREDSTRSSLIRPGQHVTFNRPNVTEYLTVIDENNKMLCSNQAVYSSELFEIDRNQQVIVDAEAQVSRGFKSVEEAIRHGNKVEEEKKSCSIM